MKNGLRILGLTLLLLVVSWLFPAWWWILFLPVAFMAASLRNLVSAFGNAFVAGVLAWGSIALFQYVTGSETIANRVAQLFGLQSGVILLLVVMLLAGVIAGVSGMTGAAIRSLLFPKKKEYYY